MRTRVLHVAAGVEPFVEGDAAECVAGLARALEAAGVAPLVIAPRPDGIDPGLHGFARRLRPVALPDGDASCEAFVFEGKLRGGRVPLLLLDHPRAAELAGSGAVAVADALGLEVDVVHAHGAAVAAAVEAARASGVPSVFTSYDGEDAPAADAVAALCPRWGGVDEMRWNPATDARIAAPYSADDLDGKLACREALRGRGVSPQESSGGMSPRGRSGGMRARGLRAGEPVVARLPDADPRAALAGADFVVLSPDLPRAWLWAMRALRYGTPPVAAGGDVVIEYDEGTRTGTGFTYDAADPETLAVVERRAAALFCDGDRLDALRRRIMRLDVSWELPARRYADLYATLAERAAT